MAIWTAEGIAGLVGRPVATVRKWWSLGHLEYRLQVMPYMRVSFGWQLAAFLKRWYPSPNDLDPNSPDPHIRSITRYHTWRSQQGRRGGSAPHPKKKTNVTSTSLLHPMDPDPS